LNTGNGYFIETAYLTKQCKVMTKSFFPDVAPDLDIDITNDVCPMTFVRTRLALDKLNSGQILRIRLRGSEPVQNVPRTAEAQGHQVLAITESAGITTLLLRKG
jgi:TusA-related sulfurtransferase